MATINLETEDKCFALFVYDLLQDLIEEDKPQGKTDIKYEE